MSIFESLQSWARRLRRDAVTLWFAYRRPDTPWLVKGLCVFVVAYALSPLDLIPDFVPVLGYLDDVLLLPGLIWLALRLLPAPVVAASRLQAEAWLVRHSGNKPHSYLGAIVIVSVWCGLLYAAWLWWR
ncbi:MAG TPA: YkvA family protein [Pseudoxanthomonas sp.]